MATIMIVEDDRQTNDAVAEYLKSFGYRMLSAYDGDEALQLFECNNIDLIILDIMIPKKTGLAVLHTIRAKSSVPILMLTAIGDEYTQVTSFDEQADDYITNPIKGILDATNHMAVLDRKAACKTATNDEIGILANQINQLYQNLLSTIEHLQEEKDKVSEAEKQKIDFLRSASHELKTPVTALNAMLENMILKVGKYSDYEEYLPLCKERTEQLSKMISEVLDASKLGTTAAEEPQALAVDCYLSELCKQYRLIAQANGISFQEAFPETFTITLPPKTFARAFSNILSNAVAYTLPGHSIFVRIDGRKLIVENECEPISAEHLKHIFEPFYRPDYARNQNDGGNGLGLYIVASILDSLKLSYSLEPIQKPLGMRFTITF